MITKQYEQKKIMADEFLIAYYYYHKMTFLHFREWSKELSAVVEKKF